MTFFDFHVTFFNSAFIVLKRELCLAKYCETRNVFKKTNGVKLQKGKNTRLSTCS